MSTRHERDGSDDPRQAAGLRDQQAMERDTAAAGRDRQADQRDWVARSRLATADQRDRAAEKRDRDSEALDDVADGRAGDSDAARIDRARAGMNRDWSGRDRDLAAADREGAVDDGRRARRDRAQAAADRLRAAEDRVRAEHDLQLAREQVERLRHALAEERTIGMAIGMIMVAELTDAEEAFDQLREAAMRQNVRVHDVARLVVGDHIPESHARTPAQRQSLAPAVQRRQTGVEWPPYQRGTSGDERESDA